VEAIDATQVKNFTHRDFWSTDCCLSGMVLLICILLAPSASAQFISLGVKGGVPLGQTLEGQTVDPIGVLGKCGECASSRTLPYIVGPSLEVYLTPKLRLSVDALYGRAVYDHTSTTFWTMASGSFNDEKHAVDRLEIPILLQYTFGSWHGVHPFLAGGVSVRYSQDAVQSRQYGSIDPPYVFVGPREAVSQSVPNDSTDWGATFAVGARFGRGRLHPSIEYRFTHWTDQPIVVRPLDISFVPVAGPATLQSRQNQSELIAGLMMEVTGADSDRDAGRGSHTGFGNVLSRISVGAKGGLPLTQAFEVQGSGDFINNPYFDKCGECSAERTVSYVIGPAIEIRIAGPYSVSAEALYSRADYNHTSSSFSASGSSFLQDAKNTVNRWEFPLIMKFKISRWRLLRPFVGLGASAQYNRASTVQWLVGSHSLFGGTSVQVSNVTAPPVHSVVAGPTVAVGTRIGGRRLSPMVEFRYTRWFDAAIAVSSFNSAPPVNGPVTVRSIQNQAQLLVGLMF
jgi:hypothetical protein